MNVLIDHNIPKALCYGLNENGMSALPPQNTSGAIRLATTAMIGAAARLMRKPVRIICCMLAAPEA